MVMQHGRSWWKAGAVLLFCCWFCAFERGQAQQLMESPVEGYSEGITIGGSFNAVSEFYAASGIAQRQPGFIQRLSGTMTLNVFGIRSGVTMLYSTEDNRFQQSLNAIQFYGRYHWISVAAGMIYPAFSPLISSGVQVLGGQLTLDPAPISLTLVAGQSRRAVEGDTAARRIGVFRQMLYGGAVGVRFADGGQLRLQGIYAEDDPKSLQQRAGATPQRNFVVGMQTTLSLFSGALLDAEVAASLFQRDSESDTLPVWEIPEVIRNMFPPNLALTAGYAFRGNLNLQFAPVAATAQFRYISPAFVSLGLGTQRNDEMEFRFAPSVNFARWSLNADLSLLKDNLLGVKVRTSTLRSATLVATVLVRDNLSLSGMGSWYRQQVDPANTVDSVSIVQTRNDVWNSYVSATWSYHLWGIPFSTVLSVQYQQMQLAIRRLQQQSKSQNTNAAVQCSQSWSIGNHSFNLGIGGNWTEQLRNWFGNFSWSVPIPIGDRTLQLSTVVNGYVGTGSVGQSGQWTATVMLSYPVWNFMTITFNGRMQWVRASQQYQEIFLNLAVVANF